MTFALLLVVLSGATRLEPYFDPDGSEVILAYDDASGASKSWYYDEAKKRFAPSPAGYQLPAQLGLKGPVRMAPYVGGDKSEVVLVWEPATGKSLSWFYDRAKKAFQKAEPKFQLPQQKGAEVVMAPYLAKDGSEVVLVWDAKTGKSANWYFDKAKEKFQLSEPGWQLPATLGLAPPVEMVPYLTKDGSEVIHTWSRSTGESINWYFDDAANKYQRSEAKFQLPRDPGVKGDVFMHPYLTSKKDEVILVWSGASGASVSWYFDDEKDKFARSPAGYQLPQAPLGGATMLMPYIDDQGNEIILAWSPATGASKEFYRDDKQDKMVPATAEWQLPDAPLK